MSASTMSRAWACTEQHQDSSGEGLHPSDTGSRRPLRKCRKRVIAAPAREPQGPAKKKTKKNAATRPLPLKSTLSFHIPEEEDSTAEQPFVTDDDEDSISSAETNRPAANNNNNNNNNNPPAAARSTDNNGVPPTAATTVPPEEVRSPSRAGSLPPTPLPTRLTQAQIHSKFYTFPHKLFDLMEDNAASDGNGNGHGNGHGHTGIVSWSTDGTTFCVHDHARFAAEYLPTYFGHHQFRSFDRQLNFWGFEIISPRNINNKSFGGKAWKHPFFQRGKRHLLQRVTRKLVIKPQQQQQQQQQRQQQQSSSSSSKKRTRGTTTRTTFSRRRRCLPPSSPPPLATAGIVPRHEYRMASTFCKPMSGWTPPRTISPVRGMGMEDGGGAAASAANADAAVATAPATLAATRSLTSGTIALAMDALAPSDPATFHEYTRFAKATAETEAEAEPTATATAETDPDLDPTPHGAAPPDLSEDFLPLFPIEWFQQESGAPDTERGGDDRAEPTALLDGPNSGPEPGSVDCRGPSLPLPGVGAVSPASGGGDAGVGEDGGDTSEDKDKDKDDGDWGFVGKTFHDVDLGEADLYLNIIEDSSNGIGDRGAAGGTAECECDCASLLCDCVLSSILLASV